ncbi:type VII secretion AAA-ATPase EccA [Mycobacterium sp. M1]|uniref:Type VII secretion AAA-ATPase EccA n=1 Tax=Mycolicibacter acidiphilus TaxID=2835306 RepID=A0ABS5REV0_9MYCO|nr:type VII secretion AAA-ATPase EccA [Mycolicibacter acidiphilus]MBS9532802.1 type VII secretion AAA-ATPase EccA [Mycolicibacter acidiphilus]
MNDHLVRLFGSAVGMLGSAPNRSLELFSEITSYDEAACDAWVGRIRCGDLDRVTLFRAWYSRREFGQLAGAAEISMSGLNARIPVGGPFGEITYPINSPLAITMGFAVSEAQAGNYADAMEALDENPIPGTEHLVGWTKTVVYAAAGRWTDVIEQARQAPGWPDPFLSAAGVVAHGVAAANMGLFTEAERRLTDAHGSTAGKACEPVIAWYLAMAKRGQGNEEGAHALLEWLQANHPEPKVTAALKDPSYQLDTISAENIAARKDPWDSSSAVADTSDRDKLLDEAQAELDRQIGLGRVKEQIQRYRAATQMAKVRAAKGMKVANTSKHMIFAGPPGTGKTTIARVVANILAGLGVIAEPKLIETSRKDFVGEYLGHTAVKTSKTIDRALGGVLFIDEAYTLVQESSSGGDQFGQEALDTLLARMENDRDRLVVIIAGYAGDIDRLLETNDGLRSRFSTRIEFESYSPSEIREIAEVIATANDSKLDPDALKQVEQAATVLSERTIGDKPALDVAGNGRYARQLVETAEQCRDMRLTQSPDFESLDADRLSEINGADMAEAISAVHYRLNIGD